MSGAVDQIIEATLDELQRGWAETGRQGLAAWREAQQMGQKVTGYGRPPYGYRWKRILVIEEDPYEQEIEALFSEFFAAQLSNSEIAAVLNQYGYVSRHGKPWNEDTIGLHRKRLGFQPSSKPRCEIEGCNGLATKGGLCGQHRYKLETYGDPLAKGGHAAKTHCPQGHPYDGDNLYISPQGQRVCRICNRAKVRRFYERQRAATRTSDTNLG